MLTAAVTIAIAIGAGHIMQYQLSDSAEFQQPAPRPSSFRPQAPRAGTTDLMIYSPLLPPPAGASQDGRIPADPADAVHPIAFPAGPLDPVAVPPDFSGLTSRDKLAQARPFGTICQVAASAEAGRGAVIHLKLDACERDIPLTVSHAGLVFSAVTGRDGHFSADIPAFEPDATIEVAVAGQPPITLSAEVPDAIWYDRVALVWDGSAPLAIHALELGAGPGSAGHVSAAHPRGPERAEAAEGGFLLSLGAPVSGQASFSEIYSFPSGRITRQGTVRLSVSAEVTRAACNRTLPVRILQSTGGTALRETSVPVAFPDCESVGDILVLKNLLQDLKIARN
jgi:hypothetical protein